MSAKTDLFERLRYLGSAIALGELVDNGIAQSEHNGRANLLRKGVGIIGFNLLEDYVKSRTIEALSTISSSGLAFDNLPEKMRTAATLNALETLNARAKIEKKSGRDWLTLIQTESQKIYSTAGHTYELSSVSLASGGSNVTASEISEILVAFGISGGWGTLKAICDAIGGGLPDLAQAYQNLADRRHSAAHVAGFKFSHTWLTSMAHEILAIAAALDIVLSAKLRMISRLPTVPAQQHDISTATNYLFLEENRGFYRETKMIGGRSRKNWHSLGAALAELKPTLVQVDRFLIVIGSDRRISDWHT
ncbi:hypothetical protein H2514_12075 [Lysobacter sp. CW239]|uniref:HEPN domain-containing protein n=1 Tax=Lysobacteraceae TaxID=32033 RepID=UPI0012ECB16E|nr:MULTISPECIES: HEPN domain-containing protein [Lysobacter]QOD90894.1 hypothetical protein H2514_12075 [Lysobacter sp. CW239]